MWSDRHNLKKGASGRWMPHPYSGYGSHLSLTHYVKLVCEAWEIRGMVPLLTCLCPLTGVFERWPTYSMVALSVKRPKFKNALSSYLFFSGTVASGVCVCMCVLCLWTVWTSFKGANCSKGRESPQQRSHFLSESMPPPPHCVSQLVNGVPRPELTSLCYSSYFPSNPLCISNGPFIASFFFVSPVSKMHFLWWGVLHWKRTITCLFLCWCWCLFLCLFMN